MKLLMWLLLFFLVILALRKKAKPLSSTSNGSQDRAGTTERSDGQPPSETMVCCAHCQLYLPGSEAIVRGGQSYCSVAHADLH